MGKMQLKVYFPHTVQLSKTVTFSLFLFVFLQLFDGIECEFPIFFIYMMIDGKSYSPLRLFITVPEGGHWKNSRQGAAFDEKSIF